MTEEPIASSPGRKNALGLAFIQVPTHKREPVERMIDHYGMEGYGAYMELMRMVGQEGYFMHWDEHKQRRMARHWGMPVERVAGIVELCLDQGLFDEELYSSFSILTNRDIQYNFFCVAGRKRQTFLYIEEFVLIGNHLERELERREVTVEEEDEAHNLTVYVARKLTKKELEERESGTQADAQPLHTDAQAISASEMPILDAEIQRKRGEERVGEEKRGEKKRSEESREAASATPVADVDASAPEWSGLKVVPKEDVRVDEEAENANSVKQNGGKNAKKAKGPRPRSKKHYLADAYAEAWIAQFQQPYPGTKEANAARKQIILALERQYMQQFDESPPPDETSEEALKLWQTMLAGWGKLDNFYQRRVSWENIASDLPNLINILRNPKKQANGNARPSRSGQMREHLGRKYAGNST